MATLLVQPVFEPSMRSRGKAGFPVLITGPSTTGKSGLARHLMDVHGCEAINSDKFYLYRGCQVGSLRNALPASERDRCWLFGVLGPETHRWEAPIFCHEVRRVLGLVESRGALAVIEGCSFSYNSALLKSGLVRTAVALCWPPAFDLEAHLHERAGHLLSQGLVVETERLLARYPDHVYPLEKGVYYRNLVQYLRGRVSLEAAQEQIADQLAEIAVDQLARYRRETGLLWIEVDPNQPEAAQEHLLSKLGATALE